MSVTGVLNIVNWSEKKYSLCHLWAISFASITPVFALFLASGNAAAAITAAYLGGDFRENFDTLAGSSWVNNGTLPAWFAYRSTSGGNIYWGRADGEWENISTAESNSYVTRNGQTGTGLLNVGGNTSNRALGVRTLYRDIAFALVLRNESTNTFACITLEYYGEQWQQLV